MSVVAELDSPVQLHPQYGTRKKTKSPKERARAAKKQQHAGDPFKSKVMAIHLLRVTVKSMVEESRILRREEKRAGIRYGDFLHKKRTKHLRTELQHANLALAYLRGRKYQEIEFSRCKAYPALASRIAGYLRQAFENPVIHNCTDVVAVIDWLNAV